jgi:signal transduction histidine kinase
MPSSTALKTLRSRLLDAEQIEIVFEDDGVGIAETNLPRVFEAFYTTKLGQGGSGLGMHIAQSLVKKVLGGTLRIESQIGQGTRFILIMPRIAPNLQAQEDGQAEEGQEQAR